MTFQGPFRRRPHGILTFSVWKVARARAQEPPRGTGAGYSGVIFHHANAAFVELAESVPSGGQRSGDCHAHPSQLRTGRPERASAENLPSISVGPPPSEEASERSQIFFSSHMAGWSTADERST